MSDHTSGTPVATTFPTAANETSDAEARAQIERLTASTVEPLLTGDEVDQLIEVAKCVDTDNYTPNDSEWTATWDIARAVLEGWRIKLGKASAMHNFADGGVTLHREQVFSNIEKMIKLWERKVAYAVRATSEWEPVDQDDEYNP